MISSMALRPMARQDTSVFVRTRASHAVAAEQGSLAERRSLRSNIVPVNF
jgi:hypothetical protein